MSSDFRERTRIIVGESGIDKLEKSKVIIFGVGGVGSFVVESLARAGVGNISVVDSDVVDITNINRQLPALHSTIGKAKVDVIEKRVKDINPNVIFNKYKEFYSEMTSESLLNQDYDFVVDAIDSVKSKIHLIESCYNKNLRVISSMGMGNKLDPTKIEIADIYKTEMCPLAKVVRRELKKRKIPKLTVVYSKEMPTITEVKNDEDTNQRINGSISFVPSCAGLVISSFIVKQLLSK